MTIEDQYKAAKKYYKIDYIKPSLHSYGETYHIMDRNTGEFLHGCSTKKQVVEYFNQHAIHHITEKWLLGSADG